MPLSKGTKTAMWLGGGVALALLWSSRAKADELPEIVTPPPPDPIEDPDPAPPPPPKPGKCDFVGCPGFKPSAGAAWTETYTALFMQSLGYNINPAVAGFSLLSDASRAKVLHFQQNYNRVAPTMSPKSATIDADGLVGNMTIAALKRARLEVQKRMQTWAVIVSLTP